MKAFRTLTLSGSLVLAAALWLTGCASTHHHRSQPATTGYPPPPPPPSARPAPPAPKPSQKEPWVTVSITTAERQVICDYLSASEQPSRKGKKSKGLPPGLQKKVARGGSLPPGWEKKVCKGEVLPIEVYEQCQPLPQEVIVKLPPPPPGTVIVTIGGKVARILTATREILDVFEVKV